MDTVRPRRPASAKPSLPSSAPSITSPCLLLLVPACFLWTTSVCFAVPSYVLPLSTFPSLPAFFFFSRYVACCITDGFLIIPLSDGGYARAALIDIPGKRVHIRDTSVTPFLDCESHHVPATSYPQSSEAVVLLPPSLCKYLSPAFLRLATLPSTRSPLPSRARSGVLTLGFVQICSLWRWKVVMGAKKNSLAQTLTTMLVFLMKPNENSIFYPCYSLPSSSLPPPPPLSTSGASNLRKRFLIPTGDFSTLM